jgi:uncharacterized protein YndB with AHSA1/START domain
MNELTMTISKQLAAAPETVFDAWTTPQHMAGWLSPMTTASIPLLELRVGGRYQIDMHGEEKDYVHTGQYLEIDRPNKLVFSWHSEGTGQEETIVTLEFAATEGGTLLTLTHDRFPTAKSRDDHTQGWTAIFEKLEHVFASSATA